MELVAPKKNLERLLGRCKGVADKKSTMPVLANVLLSAKGNLLRVAATDLYLTVSGATEAEIKRQGAVALPANDVYERIRAMPEGPVRITVSDSAAAEVSAVGAKRRYTLHGLPGGDFPHLPELHEDAPSIDLAAGVLHKLIKRTMFSISTDETRPHINCARFECHAEKGKTPGQVRMVTTDGHRLSKAEAAVPGLGHDATMLLPLKAVQELKKLLDDGADKSEASVAQVAQSGPNAFFKLAGVQLCVKLVDAQFPPYDQVIPSGSQREIRTPRGQLIDALRAVKLAASERTGGVKLAVGSGALRISSESPESGAGFDEVPVEYDGPELAVGFNAEYLVQVLSAIEDDEEISLGISGELDPAVLRPAGAGRDEFVAVVMPMRI